MFFNFTNNGKCAKIKENTIERGHACCASTVMDNKNDTVISDRPANGSVSGSSFYADKLNWLPDIKTVFETASRRFSENKAMNHALILIDIGGLTIPSDGEMPDNMSFHEIMGDVFSSIAKLVIGACGKHDLVGMAGVDRFAVITSGFANRVELEKLISKIIYRIRVADFAEGIRPTAEAGAAILENNSLSAPELFKAAELALFKVKENADDDYAIYEHIPEEQIDRADLSDNICRIQKVMNYAFGKFSSEEETGAAVKDVLAKIGEIYELDRIYVVTTSSLFSGVIQWNSRDTLPVTQAQCNELFTDEAVKCYSRGECYTRQGGISAGLFQGFALVGAVCFERRDGDISQEGSLMSEINTIAKMLSVYQVTLLRRLSAEDELLYSRAALEENRTACYSVDADSYRVVYHNSYAEKILPWIKLGEKCAEPIIEILERIKSGDEKGCDSRGVFHFDTFEKHLQKWLSTAIVCTRRYGGEYAFLICSTDISELMDNAKTKDKLTGLLTYEGFEIEAEKAVNGSDDKFCLALFKIFNFRNINDEFGYEIGDEILKETSDKLMLIMGENERAARSSGASFVALLKLTDIKILKAKLEYLFKVVEDDMIRKYPLISFAFMCGIYPIEKEDYKLSAAMDKANAVIKNLKKGRYLMNNAVEVYDFELNKSLEVRKQIESEMVNALRNNEFETVYQPKVDLRTGLVYGAEALIRWNKPDGTVMQPGTFVPIFEDNEFVLEMDHWVYRRVFSNMRQWTEENIDLPVISVNVSRLHLRDPKFPEKFERIVDNYGIPHSNVEVEMTESTFVKNYDRLVGILNDIRSRGFKISVDDFGTGYSTLNLISVLPVDVLKLDGNFFMKNQLTDKNRKVIESILMLAKKLGLSVISEGVETDEQVAFLKENDCDAVQGYYYYKPMSETAFRELLIKQQKSSALK